MCTIKPIWIYGEDGVTIVECDYIIDLSDRTLVKMGMEHVCWLYSASCLVDNEVIWQHHLSVHV